MSRDRSRMSILNELLSFPSIREKDWETDLLSHANVLVGDLVSMNSAPETKWYLSWVRDIEINTGGFDRFLLESIEDGEMCWWSNIGLNIYNRKTVSERPTWHWCDKQFAMYDRWLKVGKRNNTYIIIPVLPVFDDYGGVTLDVRIRFGFSDFSNPRSFQDWKKLTMKVMDEYYKESVKIYHSDGHL